MLIPARVGPSDLGQDVRLIIQRHSKKDRVHCRRTPQPYQFHKPLPLDSKDDSTFSPSTMRESLSRQCLNLLCYCRLNAVRLAHSTSSFHVRDLCKIIAPPSDLLKNDSVPCMKALDLATRGTLLTGVSSSHLNGLEYVGRRNQYTMSSLSGEEMREVNFYLGPWVHVFDARASRK
jgi:hypothetical protein